MTLLWFEGFETNTGEGPAINEGDVVLSEYATRAGSGIGTGRLGLGKSLTSGAWTSKTAAEQPTINFFGIGIQASQNIANSKLTFYDSTGQVHCNLRIIPGTVTQTIRFELRLGATGVPIIQSEDQQIDSGDFWRYVQIEFTLSPTATTGTAKIQVDAQATKSVVNVITSEVGSQLDTFKFDGDSTSPIDDFYWCSDQGPGPYNGWLGPVKTEAKYSSAIGTAFGWAPDSGANWDRVNDGPGTDKDGSIVSAASDGLTDTHAFSPLAYIDGNILAVKHHTMARIEGVTSTQNINHVYWDGATNTSTGPFLVNTTEYDGQTTDWTLNPKTGGAWSLFELENGEFGYETTA